MQVFLIKKTTPILRTLFQTCVGDFLKDEIKMLKSFSSDLIKIKSFLILLNLHVCVTSRFYETEYMGSGWLSKNSNPEISELK